MVEKLPVSLGENPPDSDRLTEYDQAHLVAYIRILDAAAAGQDWRATARLVLSLDTEVDPAAAKRIYDAHLARARWMTRIGYRHLKEAATDPFLKG